MSLIIMVVNDTEENGRHQYTKQTLEMLVRTVNWDKNRICISDNNSCQKTKLIIKEFLPLMCGQSGAILNTNIENIGTAAGLNQGLINRHSSEYCVKIDNDVVVHEIDWINKMMDAMLSNPEIGVLGLKRNDVLGDFIKIGDIEYGDDIMGTCTMFSPKLLDKIGRSIQFSTYGYEDNITNCRSLKAGFKNAYLTNIKITHLDEGGTEYTEWKKKEAGIYASEAAIVMDLIRTGQLSYYYPFE